MLLFFFVVIFAFGMVCRSFGISIFVLAVVCEEYDMSILRRNMIGILFFTGMDLTITRAIAIS